MSAEIGLLLCLWSKAHLIETTLNTQYLTQNNKIYKVEVAGFSEWFVGPTRTLAKNGTKTKPYKNVSINGEVTAFIGSPFKQETI